MAEYQGPHIVDCYLKELLHSICSNDENKLVKTIAPKMQVPESTAYNWLRGNRTKGIPFEFVKWVAALTHDPRLLRYLSPPGCRIVEAGIITPSTTDIEKEGADVLIAASLLIKNAREALANGNRINGQESRGLKKDLDMVRHELNELEETYALHGYTKDFNQL